MMFPKKFWVPLLTSVCFAGSFVAGKYTTYDLTPLTTTLLRYIVALLFLGLLSTNRKIFPRPAGIAWVSFRRDLFYFALLGLFGIVGYHFFFFSSLHYTRVANTAIINATNPIVTGMMAAAFIKEKLTLKNYIGIAGAVAGVLLLISQSHTVPGNFALAFLSDLNIGDLLMLLAVISWAAYGIIIKKLSNRYSGLILTIYAFVFGVLELLILTIFENPVGQLRTMSLGSLLSVLYMGIFASAVGIWLYNLSIEAIGPTRTSSLVYSLVPIFTAVLAGLFFAEPITAVMVISGGLIIISLRYMFK
jgi:drug/metabolite transporter (DMT)-like permease